MSDLIRLAALRKVPVIVDPKVEHFSYYKGVTVLTPNHLEAAQASGLHGDGDQTIDEAGAMIRQRLGCQSVLITRGEKGMSLYERNGASWHLPTKARQVYDVTGAGDTVIGTLALALAAGASIKTGAVMANYAAGIVVGMVGTATVSPKQLSEVFGDE
jgi:D-beta-D-heptose 7-phosphate kinase/D-beta-D-heptose 1-phosphate adenosyltransferase